jgi:hypothetical protein
MGVSKSSGTRSLIHIASLFLFSTARTSGILRFLVNRAVVGGSSDRKECIVLESEWGSSNTVKLIF